MTTLPPANLRHELAAQFRDHQRFTDIYSPLQSRLYATLAGWLAGDAADPVVEWLLEVSAARRPFDVVLLLAAALHRDVLAGEPEAAELGRYYPTSQSYDATAAEPPAELPRALRETIIARREALGAFIRERTIQTNETGRGLAWLLPAACTGWPAIHLIELGASAGLNLVAERRAFRLIDAADPSRVLLELGSGRQPQFTVESQGPFVLPQSLHVPDIRSRTGGDVAPLHLHSSEDELRLASFVWADQTERFDRLREGIDALRSAEHSAAPVRLLPLRLPDELPAFLDRVAGNVTDAPLVICNTVMTMYLPQRGTVMRHTIHRWAAARPVPVLWLQWEPLYGVEPPEHYWQAWTAACWPGDRNGEARQWQLAWVQPHGTAIRWLPGWKQFLEHWSV
jgi:hypothetical protein